MKQAIRWSLCLTACLMVAGGAFAADSHSIFGTITTDVGKPLAGVNVEFGGELASVATDAAGYYESEDAVEGSVYLVEPGASGWTFSPARRAVVMGSGDEQVNFVGEAGGGQLAGLLFAPPVASSAQPKAIPDYPTVVYPNGGETWQQGGSYNILWTYDGPIDSMQIELWKNMALFATITSGTPDDGSFWWKVPPTVVAGNDYRIVVRGGNYGTLNHDDFTIEAAPLVTYPNNSGVCWHRGQGYQIKWQGFPGANVKIQLYRGSILSRGIAWSTPNDGSFWWSVPDDQRAAGNYKIKVTAHSNAAVSDMSDNPFAILDNPRVTYPTYPGVLWVVGGNYNITWHKFIADQVRIDLLRGTTLDRTIHASTANDGSFCWQVPYDLVPSIGPAFKVRVRAVGCAEQSDKSNNYFEMRRVAAVTYPTGNGITWGAGSPYTINWHGFSSGNVKIELLKGWALDRVITNSTANDGSFKWWVPADQVPGTNYRIRITGDVGAIEQDVSDRNFTIALVPLVKYPSASGISLGIGDVLHITWQGFQTTDVRIYLERWNSFDTMVSPGTPNDGSFNWTIPPGATTGNGFKIKIRDIPGSVSDTSNHPFQITS